MNFNVEKIKIMSNEEYDNFIKKFVEEYNNDIEDFISQIQTSKRNKPSLTNGLFLMIPLLMFAGQMPSKITEQDARKLLNFIRNN